MGMKLLVTTNDAWCDVCVCVCVCVCVRVRVRVRVCVNQIDGDWTDSVRLWISLMSLENHNLTKQGSLSEHNNDNNQQHEDTGAHSHLISLPR